MGKSYQCEDRNIAELEQRIAEIRSRSLLVVCVTPNGKMKTMTVRECAETGAYFLSVAADDLDKLLGAELGGDEALPNENRRKPNKKRGQYL